MAPYPATCCIMRYTQTIHITQRYNETQNIYLLNSSVLVSETFNTINNKNIIKKVVKINATGKVEVTIMI